MGLYPLRNDTLSKNVYDNIFCSSHPDSFRSMLSPKAQQTTSTSNGTSTNTGHVLFRDFLREQIDNLMTGDGRDGLAEGRRGTHVEVSGR